jgi:CRP/FNR family transcriptional regulator, cyclic AMP receptor protein
MYPQENLTMTLRHLPWFTGLGVCQLEKLASIATLRQLDPGDTLFREGERDDSLYVLLEGQVALEIEVPTQGQALYYTAEMLDIIGWSSMTPIVRQRIASARALQPSLLIGFNSKLLQQLCEDDHEIGYVVYRRLANVVANRFLTMRLCLMDIITHVVPHEIA